MAVKTYDPKQVSVIVGSQPLSGWGDGDFCSVEYNEDHWSLYTGADGEGTRSKSANMSGKFTLTLAQSATANEYLSQLAATDRLTGKATFPMLVKDNLGTSLYSAATAWIVKQPTAAFGKDVGTREWVIETDELIAYTGSNG